MEGIVHRYFVDLMMGVIKGRGGKTYPFTKSDWVPRETEPLEGLRVVFEVDPGRAVNVRLQDSDKKKDTK